MHSIKAYKTKGLGEIKQLSIKRDWMDKTWNSHAYHCFPISLANQLGWGISFPEDIVFIWDGISDSSPDHVKILKGQKYANSIRGNATISFNTGINFKTEDNISLLQMPVPNNPIDGVSPISTLISSSFFNHDMPCAWLITKPNVEITIAANTPIISILPIDLTSLQNSIINILPASKKPNLNYDVNEYFNIFSELNKSGKWTDFYRKATDHKGNKLGSHQVKSIKLEVLND